MIEGRVTPDGKAMLSLAVRTAFGAERRLAVQVDTAFDQYLALTEDAVAALGLASLGDTPITLADGSVSSGRAFRLVLRWHGEWVATFAVELSHGETNLLGMALMDGCDLHVEIVPGGRVTLTERPEPY